MRALRIFVVVMGVVLVVGFGVVFAIIAGRLSRREAATSPAHGFAKATLDLPRGARIAAMTTAPDRLILELALPGGGGQIVVLDLATGARLGTIALRSSP